MELRVIAWTATSRHDLSGEMEASSSLETSSLQVDVCSALRKMQMRQEGDQNHTSRTYGTEHEKSINNACHNPFHQEKQRNTYNADKNAEQNKCGGFHQSSPFHAPFSRVPHVLFFTSPFTRVNVFLCIVYLDEDGSTSAELHMVITYLIVSGCDHKAAVVKGKVGRTTYVDRDLLQVLGFVLVFIGSIPAALAMLKGREEPAPMGTHESSIPIP